MIARRIAVLAVLGVAACREKLPDAGGPFGDRVADYVPKIEKATGLTFKTPPKLELRTRDQVRAFLVERVREPQAQADLVGQTAMFHVLGMIPDTLDLAKYLVSVLTEQVLGFYDPKTKVLYVVQGAPDDYAGITIMHELVHALQDQYVNLDSIQRVSGNDDAQTAVQAVIEGQATYEQMAIMAGPSNIALAMPSGMDQIRATIREASASQPIFSSSPMVIQEAMLFPYINGADFVHRFKRVEANASPFGHLPVSTEQVLHDSAFFGAHPDLPIPVHLPQVAGTFYENTMGEFGTRLFVYKHLKNVKQAASVAAGWGGDRFVMTHVAGGDAIAWVTVWDTPLDAAEFVSAVDDVTATRLEVKAARTGESRLYRGRARTVAVSTRGIDGKQAVLYVDVPSGANVALLDLSRVTLR